MRPRLDRLLLFGVLFLRAPGADAATPEDVGALLRASRFPEADKLAREILAERDRPRADSAVYDAAQADYERALAIQDDQVGPDSPEVASTLIGYGLLCHRTNRLEEARKALERAVSILRKAYGPENGQLALAMSHLADVLQDLDDFQGSLELQEKALAIREKLLGPSSVQVAAGFAGLGDVLVHLGRYDRAKASYERELSIFERAEGPDGANVAKASSHLAVVSLLLGDHALARGHAERALALQERLRGPHHPEVGSAVDALASIDLDEGDHEAARAGFERALRVWEKAYGGGHVRVARALDNLGIAEGKLGRLEEAKKHVEAALAIQEKVSADDTRVASSLCDLAMLQMSLGRPDEARAALDRAVAIREAKLGADHPLTGLALAQRGEAEAASGEDASARETLEHAVEIEERTLGPQHPALASALVSLASVDLGDGHLDDAFETALRAERIGREHLVLAARVLPERQALRYEATRASGSSLALTIATIAPTQEHGRDAWDAVIRSRALVLDELASRGRSASASDDPKVADLVERLRAARERLARLAVRDLAKSEGTADAHALEEARIANESAERELAAKSAPFRHELEARQRGFEQVVAALPSGAALVGYASYDRVGSGNERAERSLLAFVVRGGGRGVATIPLGACAAVDSAVHAWNAALARSIQATTAANVAAEKAAGVALRKLVWDPVEASIGDAERVFLVPDGAVRLVSFAALPVGEDDFLIDRIPVLHYLGSERDLCAEAAGVETGRGLFVVDAPDFDRVGRAASRRAAAAARVGLRPALHHALPDCPELARLRFDPLPGARREGEAVVQAWRSAGGWRRLLRRDADRIDQLSGAAAGEAAFKAEAPGHRVVHLATHGFVLEPCARGRADPPSESAALGAARRRDALNANPLLRSGVALAGANVRASAGADEEDGVLTAQEIGSLDLSGVEWAVLSACESGTGEVVDGEGVLGLCRAFRVAGARTLLLSMWPAEDDAARRWIRELYAARLARGRSTDRAVGEASRACLRRLRVRGRHPHPFLWASFVAAGDWH